MLTARRAFDEAAEWYTTLTDAERARVLFVRADITDAAQAAEAVRIARAQEGGLAGVIHAAGVPGDGFLMNKTWQAFTEVLAPKVRGTDVLLEILKEDFPAFVLLISSMTAVFGAVGQSDYAAANAYLDGVALQRRRERIISLDWTGWAESGMAHDRGFDGRGVRSVFVDDEVGAALALAAIGSGESQLLVGAFDADVVAMEREDLERLVDVSSLMSATVRGSASSPQEPAELKSRPRHRLVTVTGGAGMVRTEVMECVIQAWAASLGVAEVDVHQTFFEAGGNSLLASRLQVSLDREFPGVISIVELFVHDTVHKLTEFITERTELSAPSTSTTRDARASGAVAKRGSESSSLARSLDEFLEGTKSIEDVLSE